MRFFQYFPALEKRGLSVQFEPLFSDKHIEFLQSGYSSPYIAIKELARRIRTLSATKNVDLIWIEKDALPWLPAFLETALIPKTIPFVLDYDDAVFHQYDMHSNSLVRQLLRGKHKALMREATLVVAGNRYLADYAFAAGARWVELLPTAIDLDRYNPVRLTPARLADTVPTVGWIGQRSTAAFLRPFAPLFKRLGEKGLMQFRAIGIDASSFGLPMESDVWSEQTEVASIQRLDVGVMPLYDGPFERGKCGYKLIQYMACGLPVVASPVGVNVTIVEHGVSGFLANSLEEWEWALRTLAKDPALRHRMGQAGRAKVEREYCLQVTAPLLAEWLKEAASGQKS